MFNVAPAVKVTDGGGGFITTGFSGNKPMFYGCSCYYYKSYANASAQIEIQFCARIL